MDLNIDHLEETIFEYIDKIKVLIDPQTWQNVLLDLNKNEMLTMVLIYRKEYVNMSQIAEYLGVPLNTATGIADRMEKKRLINRERSPEDKRVMMITFSAAGQAQVQTILKQFMEYGERLLLALTPEETAMVGQVLDKVLDIFREPVQETSISVKKIKRISID